MIEQLKSKSSEGAKKSQEQVDREFKRRIRTEVEIAFNALREFKENGRLSYQQDFVEQLEDNINILDLKPKNYKEYGLNITPEKIHSLIKEYLKIQSEKL